jgi:hypothetical protein
MKKRVDEKYTNLSSCKNRSNAWLFSHHQHCTWHCIIKSTFNSALNIVADCKLLMIAVLRTSLSHR